ncbi:MAG: ABC transporter ATP-binding protein/permease [Sphingomonas bacterium]|nr:ABC transporter ATP-binding protein/permease [Sphingomonas bacterium]
MLIRRPRPVRLAQMRGGMRRILHHLRPYLPRYRGLIGGALLALIGATLMRLIEPWPLKLVIDRVLVVPPVGAPLGILFIDELAPLALLTACAALVVAVIAVRAMLEYVSTIGFALAGSRILTHLRHDLYRHLQRLSLSFHDRARTGDLTMRVVGDIGMMREVAVTAVMPLAANVLILVGMGAVMVWLNWQLALLALAPLPLLALTTVRLGRRIQAVSREQSGREGNIAAATAESMAGMRVVQALSLEKRMSATFASQNNQSLTDGVKAKRLSAGLERSADVLIGVSTALVLWYGAVLVLRGALTPGDLIVFLAYLKNAFKPVRDFAKYSGRLAKATAAGERVVDLLEEVPDVRDAPGAMPAPAFIGSIRFEQVGFNYAGAATVLDGIDLAIEPGQIVALVGSSGAGKSTVASLLMRLYDPTAGQILIDGRDIREYTLDSLRGQISVVLQDPLLFSDSMRENIALADPSASDAEIEAAARLANAHDFIMATAEGYDTVLAERGVSLSAGQRQRLTIARAALRRNRILILDEPTTGLDRENSRLVIDALRRLARDRSVLLVTHDLDFAAEADVIAVLDHGRIVERGSHAELLDAGRAYAALFTARRTKKGASAGDPYALAS